MASAEDVAQWMLQEIKKNGSLLQAKAAREIERRFGKEFTYINNAGGKSISRGVLRAFRRLSGDDVVWARVSQYWRMREPNDGPGRSQYG